MPSRPRPAGRIADEHDVVSAAGAKAMVAAATGAFGRLDILICNAGISPPALAPLQDLSLDDFRQVMEVNFFGTLYVLHPALPQLLAADRARVVATTSAAGFFAAPTNSMYAASKAALIGLVRAVGAEGAEKGLRANLISPMAMTPMSEGFLDSKYRSLLDPGHVAKVVGWLASENCDLNGEILVAGGDTVYRTAIVQTPGQPIGEGDLGCILPALRDLSQAEELAHGMVAVQDLMSAFDATHAG